MATKTVIKRKISFEFLGELYKDAYGIFKSIPISEFPEISNTVDKEKDGIKRNLLMQDVIKRKFVSGMFPNDSDELVDFKAEDIDFDAETLITVYNRLMGGVDPKGLGQSETT